MALSSDRSKLEDRIDGRCRTVIEGVSPEIDGGRFPVKRVLGETVVAEADIFADGHDTLSAVLKYRHESSDFWKEVPMDFLGNDRWRAQFMVTELGTYSYTVEGWVDHFRSWQSDLEKRVKADQDVSLHLQIGAGLIEAAAKATEKEADILLDWARAISSAGDRMSVRAGRALSEELTKIMARHPDRRFSTLYPRELRVLVEPVLARFGAWYEMFPRSCPGRRGSHGTFKDFRHFLPRLVEMGFDVCYFPPIHPIGQAFRKGKNNAPTSQADDVGSPWGIGAAEGGHKAILPELGNLEDFRALVLEARERGIKIALDIAYQCSPDHPYVRDHPDWFKHRPDGTIQYAENPPKKYQDIYPLNFETDDWRSLWQELKSVIDFWIEQGVEIFRVDNPHTKSLRFWDWVIGEIQREHPEVILLSEAFTRRKVMYYLSKVGFTQSYNYFPWRNTKAELTEYLTEITRSPVREFFRPNLWPNTPDILPHYLQVGGRPAFIIRFVLAATLGASYGIYGPPFELCVNQAREAGSEEYLNSEKYEIYTWDLQQPGNLTGLISQVNWIRRENRALQSNDRLEFHPVDNEQIIAYSKTTESWDNSILVVVNLDPHHTQRGWVELKLEKLGIEPNATYQVHDLLTTSSYLWKGTRNYVELHPSAIPAHLFRIRRHIRTEHDLENYR